MYPVIICLLHVGIQTPVTFHFILLVLFSDFRLRFMVKYSSIKLALLLVTFQSGGRGAVMVEFNQQMHISLLCL